MNDPPDFAKMARDLGSMLVGMSEGMAQVVAAVAGYRDQLVAAGIGSVAADQMAAEYHARLVGLMFGPKARP